MEKFGQKAENPAEETNFSDHLIESNISPVHKGIGKLFEIKDNPDKIVRMESFEDLEDRYKGQVDPIVVAELGQKLYGELSDTYGINAPVEFVIGKDQENKDVVYAIVDKIEGKDLDKIDATSELTEKVEKLYESIAQYYLDKFSLDEEVGLYLADINSVSQYVYGKKKSDKEPNIYLVDTDLYIRDGKVALCNVVLWLYRHMVSVEKKFGKKFDHAREIIQKILDTPLSDKLDEPRRLAAEKIIVKTRKYLDGSLSIDDNDPHPIFSD
ncbi:MAG: hypothetical protein KGJ35_02905 [Patescibacteria group bacterium]|nr:hypothetical protein [Patescibacteria group bacterium]